MSYVQTDTLFVYPIKEVNSPEFAKYIKLKMSRFIKLSPIDMISDQSVHTSLNKAHSIWEH